MEKCPGSRNSCIPINFERKLEAFAHFAGFSGLQVDSALWHTTGTSAHQHIAEDEDKVPFDTSPFSVHNIP
jgi:hypothetical protein